MYGFFLKEFSCQRISTWTTFRKSFNFCHTEKRSFSQILFWNRLRSSKITLFGERPRLKQFHGAKTSGLSCSHLDYGNLIAGCLRLSGQSPVSIINMARVWTKLKRFFERTRDTRLPKPRLHWLRKSRRIRGKRGDLCRVTSPSCPRLLYDALQCFLQCFRECSMLLGDEYEATTLSCSKFI